MVDGERIDVSGIRRHGRDAGQREIDARRHRRCLADCTVSGIGHILAATEHEAPDVVRGYLSFRPPNWQEPPTVAAARGRGRSTCAYLCRPRAVGVRHAPLRPRPGRREPSSKSMCRGRGEVVIGLARLAGKPTASPRPPCPRAACCSSTKPTRQPGSSSCRRVRDPADLPGRRAGFMVGIAVEDRGSCATARRSSPRLRGDRAEDCVVEREGLWRGPPCDGWPGLRSGRRGAAHAKIAAMGAEAGVDAVERGSSRRSPTPKPVRRRSRACAATTSRTSTSCDSLPSWSSTTSSSPKTCGRISIAGWPPPAPSTGRFRDGGMESARPEFNRGTTIYVSPACRSPRTTSFDLRAAVPGPAS